MSFTVPPGYRPGLTTLTTLTDDQVSEVESVLETLPSELSMSLLAEGLGRVLEDRPESEIEALARSLLAVAGLVEYADVDNTNLVSALAEDIAQSTDIDVSAEARTKIGKHLVRLLETRQLRFAGRARNLALEYERSFRDVRILTDIRPVFGSDPSRAPVGGVVTAILRLQFIASGNADPDMFELALDHEDLLRLRKAVSRAVVKSESLRDFVQGSGLTFWDYATWEDGNPDP